MITQVLSLDDEMVGLLHVNVTTPREAIDAARTAIESLIKRNPRLSPQFVRLGFKDCVGGCDGCLAVADPDNRGLEVPIAALNPVVDAYSKHGVTRADLWALAAMTGADVAQHPRERVDFKFEHYGRQTCEMSRETCRDINKGIVPCDATHGPHRRFPSADLTTHELLRFFEQSFGFDMRQTVAIMGAHTLGRLRRQNSGFDGEKGWVDHQERLDNEYYQALVGGNSPNDSLDVQINDTPNWQQRFIDNRNLPSVLDRYQWEPKRGNGGNHNGDDSNDERDNRDDSDDNDNDNRDKRGENDRNRRHLRSGKRNTRDNESLGEVMTNVDIALVRDMEGFLAGDGKASCEFKERSNREQNRMRTCPVAHTLPQMAIYNSDNMAWLKDFRDVFTKMLLCGYDDHACSHDLCYVKPRPVRKETPSIFDSD